MEQIVLLMTVTSDDSPVPVAHGIYTNFVQALQALNMVGIHPGFQCTSKAIYNEDGTRAGALFASGKYVATVALMPLKTAAAIARGDSVWEVPDTVEALNA
jgi:hypothetical protein